MTPTAYIALARDIGIVLALAFLIYKIYGAGENAVKVADLKSLQTQIAEQARTLEGWRQESTDANTKLSQDLATLHADPKPPVWLCNGPASPRSAVLPAAPASTDSAHPSAGGTNQRSELDIRPQLEAFRLKYETALAECRAVYSQWPKVTP
jgi:hypothetical protein